MRPVPEEIKSFLKLIRAGKLFEVQQWIAEGKPYTNDGSRQSEPVIVALETGFHSMVEIFLQLDLPQKIKNILLCEAVSKGKRDMITLILQYGATLKEVPFDKAVSSHNPDVMRLFMEQGSDWHTGMPFAKAFIERNQQALGPFKRACEIDPSIRIQASIALRHHCTQENVKWVSLLLWAGAEPREKVPYWDYLDNRELDGYPIEDAMSSGNLQIVKKMKVDPSRDNLVNLLEHAGFSATLDVLEHLLSFRPSPQLLSTTVAESYLWRLGFWLQSDHYSYMKCKSPLPSLERLGKYGVVWKPTDKGKINSFRFSLYRATPRHAAEVLVCLAKSGLLSRPFLAKLCTTPRMYSILNADYFGSSQLRKLL